MSNRYHFIKEMEDMNLTRLKYFEYGEVFQ